MSLVKYIRMIEKMHFLIGNRLTGTPDNFSKKIGVSRTVLYELLLELKQLGADIRYSKKRKTFFYCRKISFICGYMVDNHNSAKFKKYLIRADIRNLHEFRLPSGLGGRNIIRILEPKKMLLA